MQITKTIMAVLVGLSILAISNIPATAQSYTKDTHYHELRRPMKTDGTNGVEVRLFCTYLSSHCAQIYRKIENWMGSQQNDVNWIYTPVAFNRAQWAVHARAFYVAEALGIGDRFNQKMYGLASNQIKRITSKGHFESYFTEFGINQGAFQKTWNSFGINSQVKRALAITRAANVSGVPEIVIGGKYKITSRSAGSLDKILKVADFLIKKVR